LRTLLCAARFDYSITVTGKTDNLLISCHAAYNTQNYSIILKTTALTHYPIALINPQLLEIELFG